MNSCDKYIELISAYVDGDISPDDEKLLLEHLAACSNCRELFNAMTAIKEEEPFLQAAAPDTLSKSVMAQIKNGSSAAPRHGKRIWVRALALAACLAVVIFSAFQFTAIGDLLSGSGKSDSAAVSNYATEDSANSGSDCYGMGYAPTNDMKSLQKDDADSGACVEPADASQSSDNSSESSEESVCEEYVDLYDRDFNMILLLDSSSDIVESYDCQVLFESNSETHLVISNKTAEKIIFSNDCQIYYLDDSAQESLVIIKH